MDIATIGFEADTSGLTRATTDLDKLAAKTSATEKAVSKWGSAAVISGRQVSTAMAGAVTSIGAVAPAASAATGAISALSAVIAGPLLLAVGAVVAAFVVLTGGLVLFIKNSIEAEQIQAQLEATLVATGEAAGQSAASIDAHAQALQKLTVFEDDAIKAAQTVLLTFNRIKGDTFPRATEAALDLAQATGQDLKSAMFTVGKAINDPVRGMTLLRRSGVSLSESQQKLVKDFVATGQTAKAQEVILQALEARFGGSAKAARDTLGGALTALKVAFGNLFELSGSQTSPLTAAINSLIEAISAPEFKQFLEVIGVGLVHALGFAVNTVTRLMQAFNLLVSGVKIAWEWLSKLVDTLAKDWNEAWKGVFGESMLQSIENVINKAIGLFVAFYMQIKFNFDNLADVVQSSFTNAINAAIGILNKFLTFFTEKIDWLAKKANEGAEFLGLEKRVPLIGGAGQISPLDNPASQRLNRAQETGGISPQDQLAADQAGAMNKKWIDLQKEGTKAKEVVKAVGGAARDAGDDLEGTGSKGEDAFKKIVMGAEQAIAKMKLETQTLGMSVAEVTRLKTEQELLNKANEAGLKLNVTQTNQLKELARATGEVANANAAATGTFDALKSVNDNIAALKLQQETMGMSAEAATRLRTETEMLNKATKDGTVVIGTDQVNAIKAMAAEYAALDTQVKQTQETMSFMKGIFSDLFSDLKDALISGKNMWQAFGDAALGVLSKIADKLLSMALDGTMDALFSGMSGVSNSASGGTASSSGGGMNMGGLGDLVGGLGKMFGFGGSAGAVTAASPPLGGFSATLGADGLGTTSSLLGPSASGSSMSGGLTGAMGGAGSMMGMAGGALGIATGAMGLLAGGKQSTGSKIGNVGKMVGGALMMIPTGYTQIAGAIIIALSSILPGLMGDENTKEIDQEYGQLSYGAKGFFTSGGAWGSNAEAKNLEGPLGKIGQNMDSVFKAFGGVKDAGKVWGMAMENYRETYSAGGSFAQSTSFLVDPSGKKTQWGQGSSDNARMVGMESGAVAATMNSILEGAVGPITENMRKAIGQLNADGQGSFQRMAETIQDIMGLDAAIASFGKTVTQAEVALKAIDDDMKALYDLANKYGLDTSVLDKETKRLRSELGKNFTKEIERQLMDPLTLAMEQIGDERTNLLKEDTALMAIEGYQSQAANIEEIYNRQRLAILEDFNREALEAERAKQQALLETSKSMLGSLNEYIQMLLPGGALAGEGLQAQLAGLTGTYGAARAQAFAAPLDETKIAAFMKAGAELLEFQKSFFGGDERYQSARMSALEDAKTIQTAVANAAIAANNQLVGKGGTSDPDLAELLANQTRLAEQIAMLIESQASLNAQLRRRAANGS